MNLRWQGSTPYAEMGDESGYSKGSADGGRWHFRGEQYKHLIISVDFNNKTYTKADGLEGWSHNGTVSFL